jgi:hypothetical protein
MDTWMFGQIEVEHSGFFTSHHAFRTPAATLGELTLPAFSDHGTYRTSNGQGLRLGKTRWLGGAYELVNGEEGRAERQLAGHAPPDPIGV